MSKIDCSITENYLKEKARMTKSVLKGCTITCRECPLSDYNNPEHIGCGWFEKRYPKEAISIVQKWSDEHPIKTILDDFLEKYPKANLRPNGASPYLCPYSLGYEEAAYCDGQEFRNCRECWNRPLEV